MSETRLYENRPYGAKPVVIRGVGAVREPPQVLQAGVIFRRSRPARHGVYFRMAWGNPSNPTLQGMTTVLGQALNWQIERYVHRHSSHLS